MEKKKSNTIYNLFTQMWMNLRAERKRKEISFKGKQNKTKGF